MKFNAAALALGVAVLFGATAASAQDATVTAAATASKDAGTSILSGIFDTTHWKDAAGALEAGKIVSFDPAKPADWAKIVDPKTHSGLHMSATNPEHYAQYMTPKFALQFMDPMTWTAFMDKEAYTKLVDVLSDGKTGEYWAQPGAFTHSLNPAAYVQMMNPTSYVKLAGAVAEGMISDKGWGKYAAFNPFNWMKKAVTAVNEATGTTTKTAGVTAQ